MAILTILTWSAIIALGGAIMVAILSFVWSSIIYFFQNTVIPWIRGKFGDKTADFVCQILNFADGVEVFTHRQIRDAWKWLKSHMKSSKRVITQVGPNEFAWGDTFETPEGDIGTEIKVVPLNELPPEVRDKVIGESGSTTIIDYGSVLVGKFTDAINKNPEYLKGIENDPNLKDLFEKTKNQKNQDNQDGLSGALVLA